MLKIHRGSQTKRMTMMKKPFLKSRRKNSRPSLNARQFNLWKSRSMTMKNSKAMRPGTLVMSATRLSVHYSTASTAWCVLISLFAKSVTKEILSMRTGSRDLRFPKITGHLQTRLSWSLRAICSVPIVILASSTKARGPTLACNAHPILWMVKLFTGANNV